MILNQTNNGKLNTAPEKPYSINYNTSIVDLNPFKKENTTFDFHPDSSTSSRTSTYNESNLNKILNQRKYLINKNLRFYEPVKDAEIIAQMHLLRSKLLSAKQPDYTSIGKSKTFQDIVRETKAPKKDDMFFVERELKNIDDIRLKNDEARMTKSRHSSANFNKTPEKFVDFETNEYKKNNFLDDEVKILEDESEFPCLKKFSLQYRRKKIIENVKNTKNNNQLKQKLTNASSIQSQLKTSLPDIGSNLSHTNFNYVLRKSRRFRLKNIYKPIEVTSLDHIDNSSKSNINNLSLDELNTNINIKPNTANTNLAYNSQFENFPNNLKKENTSLNCKEHVGCQDSKCEYKKLFTSNSFINLKKEYPTERYQRLKNDEVKVVQNIISDIPNTLATMSSFGRVTNVEKLLANKLSDFYTQKTRYVK